MQGRTGSLPVRPHPGGRPGGVRRRARPRRHPTRAAGRAFPHLRLRARGRQRARRARARVLARGPAHRGAALPLGRARRRGHADPPRHAARAARRRPAGDRGLHRRRPAGRLAARGGGPHRPALRAQGGALDAHRGGGRRPAGRARRPRAPLHPRPLRRRGAGRAARSVAGDLDRGPQSPPLPLCRRLWRGPDRRRPPGPPRHGGALGGPRRGGAGGGGQAPPGDPLPGRGQRDAEPPAPHPQPPPRIGANDLPVGMTHVPSEMVLEYLQGTLAAEARGEVDRHIDECTECRRLIAESAPTEPPRSGPASELAAQALPTVPVDNYIIEEEVARGGLGKILRARHVPLDRTVAVKELIRQSSMSLDGRFVREALVTAELQHPGIVPLYEAGRWPTGELFYAMKLVDGETPAARLRALRSFAERVALLPNLIAVGEALAYAHSRGIIHRDIKPSNIILGEFGETVLIDWGLAKRLA